MTGDRGTGRPVQPPGGAAGRGRVRLAEAVADLRMARDGLLGFSDPRQARAYLEAMRSCVTDIAEVAGDEAGILASPTAPVRGEASPAGSDVLAACGQALDAVDLLLLGIANARRVSLRPFGRGGEGFAASRDMTRLLLADRSAVDASSGDLLRAAAAYLTHLPGAPAPGSREGAARHDDGTPGAGGAH